LRRISRLFLRAFEMARGGKPVDLGSTKHGGLRENNEKKREKKRTMGKKGPVETYTSMVLQSE